MTDSHGVIIGQTPDGTGGRTPTSMLFSRECG